MNAPTPEPLHLPGADDAFADRVLAALVAAGRQGTDVAALTATLADAFEPPPSETTVAEALVRLAERAVAVERSRRWYAVSATEYAAGRVDSIDRGDATIRPLTADGRTGPPAFFVEANHLRGALDGDLVVVKRLKGRSGGKKGRGQGGRGKDDRARRLPPASVVEIARRHAKRLVGTLETDPDGRRWLAPYDAGARVDLEVVDDRPADEAGDVPDGHWVVAEVIRGSGSHGNHPRANLVEHLGSSEDPGVDVAVVLRHYQIPDEHPPELLAEAAALPADPGPADWKGREDLRGELTVTIDGESARDFDDAITCRRLSADRWRLGVHIADVAHYVAEGSALDREAYRRGTSVYYPERAVPMLPERLSNGLCSLRPNVPRLAMSVFLDVAADGTVHRRRFAETVIESDRRLTYAEVARLLEQPADGVEEAYGEVLAMLRQCGELMRVLNGFRKQHGSLDFDLPAGDVVLDTDGTTVGVIASERNVAHRIVEEFMIAANEAVAETLDEAEAPALYRVHDAPPLPDLEELADVLRGLGYKLPKDLERLHPRHLQAVLEEAEGSREEELVSTLVLRTMQRAIYDPQCRGHYALASRYYCHFTSPIRRYPDLVVHRAMKGWIRRDRGAAAETGGPLPIADRLDAMARHTSRTERRAESSERDLLQWKKVRFLSDRVGDVFEGRITGVQPFGLFVQLTAYHVDGLVPIRTLGDDYFVYEPERHRLVGEHHGAQFRLADEVEVVLTGVDRAHRGLNLEIVGTGTGAGRKGRNGSGRRGAKERGKGRGNGRSRGKTDRR